MTITQEQIDRYVAASHKCPFCGSDNIDTSSRPTVEDSDVNQNVFCLDCKEEWVDIYELTGINWDGDDHFATKLYECL